jgi:hypothetical protein
VRREQIAHVRDHGARHEIAHDEIAVARESFRIDRARVHFFTK